MDPHQSGLSDSSFIQRLKPVWYYASHWPGELLRNLRYWRDLPFLRGSRDMFDILQATKEYVKQEVPHILGLEPGTVVHMELPRFGATTFVLILTAGEKKAILRAYAPVHLERAQAHIDATNLVASQGINVPKILHASLDTKRHHAIFTLDEFIHGEIKAGEQLTPQDIKAMAEQIARLHSVRSTSWGRVSAERPQPFFLALTKRVKRDLEILVKRKILTTKQADELKKWVAQWEGEFQSIQEYSLTHNDILPANGLFTPDGQYYMFDLNRLQWDVAAREVVRCYYRQFRGEPAAINEFNKAYFSFLPEAEARVTWRFCKFYEVFHRMSSLVKMTPKMDKQSRKQGIYQERQARLVSELMNLVNEPFDQQEPLPRRI